VLFFGLPLGWVGAAATEQGICSVVLPKKNKKTVEQELRKSMSGVRSSVGYNSSIPIILGKTVELLRRYFSGERVSFDLPLDMRYHTTFQKAVWQAAAAIPYGQTRSYGWVARRIRNPKAVRAVGQALGANPVPDHHSLHRVIQLNRFVGRFLRRDRMKEKLLELERRP